MDAAEWAIPFNQGERDSDRHGRRLGCPYGSEGWGFESLRAR